MQCNILLLNTILLCKLIKNSYKVIKKCKYLQLKSCRSLIILSIQIYATMKNIDIQTYIHINIHVKRHTHKKMQSRYCAEIFAIITYLALYLLTQTSNCS